MRACFIVDKIDTMVPYKDTSLDLMVEAQSRGHEIVAIEGFHGISAGSAGVFGQVRPLQFSDTVR
ncbi:MAG: glutathione synthase, partial [Pseudomonadota bacterium]